MNLLFQRMDNQDAFSLLELIIVIIIVGVLSALALPRFINLIEFSRSTEAINSIRVVRDSIERCYIASNGYTKCHLNTYDLPPPNTLDVDDPGLSPNAHFTYYAEGFIVTYYITATRNTRDGANYAGATINYTYTIDPAHPSLKLSNRQGTGPYVALSEN